MVNYVCRTCLYVCDNEYSFRRLEKVKQILEIFVPEIKTFAGKYSLICEQCYYFLKNVEKFKTKCIETHKKLYSMNIETIKDVHNALLQSVAYKVPFREQHQKEAQSQFNSEAMYQQRLTKAVENSPRKPYKRLKPDVSIPITTSTVTSPNEITLTSLLNTSAKPDVPIPSANPVFRIQSAQPVSHVQGTQPVFPGHQSTQSVFSVQSTQPVFPVQATQPGFPVHQSTQSDFSVQSAKPVSPIDQQNKESFSHLSTADDLLQLLTSDITDLQGFREFAVKGASVCKGSEERKNSDVAKNDNDDIIIINFDDDDDGDEYMTKSDLVSAGILSDDSNKSAKVDHLTESGSEDDTEIIEIDLADDEGGENTGVVEFRISEGHALSKNKEQIPTTVEEASLINEPKLVSVPATAIVKQEIPEENPGFFNKQSADGYYNCRLCDKHYKTSKGLYEHTKNIHQEVKFHHCDYCSFFTLWKSALVRHCSIFHMDIFEKNNPTLAKCQHCSFETRSKEQLSHHIIESHVYNKFIRCKLCRARFADSIAVAKHVEKEHFTTDPQKINNLH